MPPIDVTELRLEGMPEDLVQRYLRAVEEAWADVTGQAAGVESRPLMSLQFQDPGRDEETVTVSVGINTQYGSTSARSPEELRMALVQHLSERFVPAVRKQSDPANLGEE